jgi:hypothetical protein
MIEMEYLGLIERKACNPAQQLIIPQAQTLKLFRPLSKKALSKSGELHLLEDQSFEKQRIVSQLPAESLRIVNRTIGFIPREIR